MSRGKDTFIHDICRRIRSIFSDHKQIYHDLAGLERCPICGAGLVDLELHHVNEYHLHKSSPTSQPKIDVRYACGYARIRDYTRPEWHVISGCKNAKTHKLA